jgi:nicotinamide mononucleotide (NMN) deamidase PncC
MAFRRNVPAKAGWLRCGGSEADPIWVHQLFSAADRSIVSAGTSCRGGVLAEIVVAHQSRSNFYINQQFVHYGAEIKLTILR